MVGTSAPHPCTLRRLRIRIPAALPYNPLGRPQLPRALPRVLEKADNMGVAAAAATATPRRTGGPLRNPLPQRLG